jgi:hypothetical protein
MCGIVRQTVETIGPFKPNVKEKSMSIKRLAPILALILSSACTAAWAQSAVGVKIIPYGIDYPLTRTAFYVPPKRGPLGTSGTDPYELSFGVRRWFQHAIQDVNSLASTEYRETLRESENWLDLYGSYGVLGHGEEVFTKAAAAYRARYRSY